MEKRYLTAREAADELGVQLATLYSYVSRGLIRSEPAGDDHRARRYRAEDIRHLKNRKALRKDPARAAEEALHWGTPVLESAISLITGSRLYYRGQDALELARTSTLEQVAGLIWKGDLDAGPPLFRRFAGESPLSGWPALPAGLTPIERFQALLPLAAHQDPGAYNLAADSVARTGVRVLRLMVAVATGAEAGPGPEGITGALQRAWGDTAVSDRSLFEAALILCADHELNVSTFTARCVTSARSSPYAVVGAGLAALQGTRHGGHTERVEALLREVQRAERARGTLADRLRRGDPIPGFGHPLYPDGDPRAAFLLERIAAQRPSAVERALPEAVAEAALALTGRRPNVDFALVALARVLGLPGGAPLTLFALGRMVGWIGHAIEQLQLDSIIRPRARYTGPAPERS